MKQRYYRYELWEDYHNGMWHPKDDGKERERIDKAIQMFRSPELCMEQMQYVVTNWIHSAVHRLSNANANHRAWIGRMASCQYAGCCIDETNEAWHLLTDAERAVANDIADKVFEAWRSEYIKKTDKDF